MNILITENVVDYFTADEFIEGITLNIQEEDLPIILKIVKSNDLEIAITK